MPIATRVLSFVPLLCSALRMGYALLCFAVFGSPALGMWSALALLFLFFSFFGRPVRRFGLIRPAPPFRSFGLCSSLSWSALLFSLPSLLCPSLVCPCALSCSTRRHVLCHHVCWYACGASRSASLFERNPSPARRRWERWWERGHW